MSVGREKVLKREEGAEIVPYHLLHSWAPVGSLIHVAFFLTFLPGGAKALQLGLSLNSLFFFSKYCQSGIPGPPSGAGVGAGGGVPESSRSKVKAGWVEGEMGLFPDSRQS